MAQTRDKRHEYYLQNREARLAWQAEYYLKNRDRLRAKSASRQRAHRAELVALRALVSSLQLKVKAGE